MSNVPQGLTDRHQCLRYPARNLISAGFDTQSQTEQAHEGNDAAGEIKEAREKSETNGDNSWGKKKAHKCKVTRIQFFQITFPIWSISLTLQITWIRKEFIDWRKEDQQWQTNTTRLLQGRSKESPSSSHRHDVSKINMGLWNRAKWNKRASDPGNKIGRPREACHRSPGTDVCQAVSCTEILGLMRPPH